MEQATEAIHRRREELLKGEDATSVSERVVLRKALTTLADLQRIAYAWDVQTAIRRIPSRTAGKVRKRIPYRGINLITPMQKLA
jgi:hypothetical protein